MFMTGLYATNYKPARRLFHCRPGAEHRPLSYLSLKSHYGSPHNPHTMGNVKASENSSPSFPTSPSMLPLLVSTAPHCPRQRLLLLHQPRHLLSNSIRLPPPCRHPRRFFYLLSLPSLPMPTPASHPSTTLPSLSSCVPRQLDRMRSHELCLALPRSSVR